MGIGWVGALAGTRRRGSKSFSRAGPLVCSDAVACIGHALQSGMLHGWRPQAQGLPYSISLRTFRPPLPIPCLRRIPVPDPARTGVRGDGLVGVSRGGADGTHQCDAGVRPALDRVLVLVLLRVGGPLATQLLGGIQRCGMGSWPRGVLDNTPQRTLHCGAERRFPCDFDFLILEQTPVSDTL